MTSSYESSSRARTDKLDVGIPRILNQLASYISSSSRRQSREIRILGESRPNRKKPNYFLLADNPLGAANLATGPLDK
jgi:hypothetical protein